MSTPHDNGAWPAIPYAEWADTCSALHLWTQVVGKYRLARTPWVNHSWHATLYVTPRGLTTGPVPDGPGAIGASFDFQARRLGVEASDGKEAGFALEPMSVAAFHERFKDALAAAGGDPSFHGKPNEIPDPVPFTADTADRPFDPDAALRFHKALLAAERVFSSFRTSFLGKVSPVHLFWGAFDLAVTRFSGREAPLHPGGVPALPDAVAQEAYTHEVSSAGFWPGGGGVDDAMFYSYAYPTPDGFAGARVLPDAARWSPDLGEFLLPYEAVATSGDPEGTLLAFLRSTYDAAAETGGWDRAALECEPGRPGVPRPLGRTPS